MSVLLQLGWVLFRELEHGERVIGYPSGCEKGFFLLPRSTTRINIWEDRFMEENINP